jgi:hypothetical protein
MRIFVSTRGCAFAYLFPLVADCFCGARTGFLYDESLAAWKEPHWEQTIGNINYHINSNGGWRSSAGMLGAGGPQPKTWHRPLFLWRRVFQIRLRAENSFYAI